MTEPRVLRDLAVEVAREAGGLLAARTSEVEVAATKSSPTDVVTEMDRRSEELIRSRILAVRPSDAILGEEGGQTGSTDGAPVRWVIDPLDGTVNYLYGLHDWAVSVGAEVGGNIVAGAVYVPRRGELFSAFAGGGAWLEQTGTGSAGTFAGFRLAPFPLAGRPSGCTARPGYRWTGPWSGPGSATWRPVARCRARSWRRCCPRSATSGGSASPRSTCVRSRPGGWTATTSAG